MQRAVQGDPFSSRFNVNWARVPFFMRQYDRTIDQFRKTLDLDPNYALPHEWLGYAYEKKGMQKEAIAEWSRALNLRGAPVSKNLSSTKPMRGRASTRRCGPWRKNTWNNSRTEPAAVNMLLLLNSSLPTCVLDDKEQAFAWLAKAAAQRSRFAVELKINPTFDPLRTDPRFEALLPEIFPTRRANTAASKEENGSRAEINSYAAQIIPQKRIAVLPFKPMSPENRDQVLELGIADT